MYVHSCIYRYMCIGGQWSMSVPFSTVPHHFFWDRVSNKTQSLLLLGGKPPVSASRCWDYNTLHCAWLWLYMGAEDETHACTANIVLAKPFLQPPTIGFLIVLIPENLHHTLYVLYSTMLGSSVTCHRPESHISLYSHHLYFHTWYPIVTKYSL